MTQEIWKFPLDLNKQATTIEMPRSAEVLCMQLQNNVPTLWARVDKDASRETRTFEVVGTGWQVNASRKYVGTYQLPPYVWHVFEIVSR